jgi:hypothetical protein
MHKSDQNMPILHVIDSLPLLLDVVTLAQFLDNVINWNKHNYRENNVKFKGLHCKKRKKLKFTSKSRGLWAVSANWCPPFWRRVTTSRSKGKLSITCKIGMFRSDLCIFYLNFTIQAIIFEISITYEMKYLNYNLTFIKHLKIHAQLKIYKWLNHD